MFDSSGVRKHKFGAKPIWYSPTSGIQTPTQTTSDQLFFASIFEGNVYKALQKIETVSFARQYKVEVKPATENFPEITWRADFLVFSNLREGDFLIIEAKGFVTSDFDLKIKFLEFTDPTFWSKVVLVTPTKKDNFGLTKAQVTLTELPKYLKEQGF